MALPAPSPTSTCLVTGASGGIGADIARELAARGHGVTLVARRKEKLDELAGELRARHAVRAEALGCDLGDAEARRRLIGEIEGLGLTVEVLVNNAGFGSGGLFHELDAEREVEMVRLNVESVTDLCGRYVPGMVERRRGAVLNVASIAGFQPIPRQATYAGTKAFVLSFTESLHSEIRGAGVAVTALCPGPVRTEFVESAGITGDAENVPGFLWTQASDVAAEGVRGLERNRRVVVPGPINRATALGGQHAPRGLLLRVASRLYPVGR